MDLFGLDSYLLVWTVYCTDACSLYMGGFLIY